MTRRFFTIFFLLICNFCFVKFSFAKTNDTTEFVLDNGLKIIVREDHSVPVVVSQVWYKVGSSYEKFGITGISHMLEHMMFKGTKLYPADSVFKSISLVGGQQNAGTGQDYTFYYQKVQAKYLEKCLELEADRMVNLEFSEKDFRSEQKVVSEERRLRYEGNPNAQLYERFRAISQLGSPYHHPVIGWMQDINSYTLKDLKKWYKTYYSPNNAILVVVGDVEPKSVYELAQKHFGSIDPQPIPKHKIFKFLPNMGAKRLELKLPSRVGEVNIGFNVPSIRSAKETFEPYALLVALDILGEGKSSRLYNELITQKKIAAHISTNYSFDSIHDYILHFRGIPTKDVTLENLEKEMLAQINNLKEGFVSDEELDKVKTQIIASEIYDKDSMYHQALQIGSFEAIGLSWKDEKKFIDNIKAVTKEQIQKVAKKYFNQNSMTIATLIPVLQN